MAKLVLDFDLEPEFLLIGISCHLKDYRFCWSINKGLGIDLERDEDLELFIKEKDINGRFPLYKYLDEEDHIDYFLLSNRCTEGFLVPEMRQIDYFFEIYGPIDDDRFREIISKIRKMNAVLTAFEVDPNQLKSKNNILI